MTTRKELIEALRTWYRGAALGDGVKILDEFMALPGDHGKHAILLLREEVSAVAAACTRNRLCDLLPIGRAS